MLVLAGCAAAMIAAPAAAQEAMISQQIFDRQGNPVLVANPSPDGREGRVVAWRACPPAALCQPIAEDVRRGMAARGHEAEAGA